MKYFITSLLLLLSIFLSAQPKTGSYPSAFQKKDIVINAGLSFAHRTKREFENAYRHGIFPAITLTGEYGITDFIGIGPYGAFFARTFRYESPDENYIFHANQYFLGLKTTFHFSPWIERVISQQLDSEHMDLYISVTGGYKRTFFLRNDYQGEGNIKIAAMAGMRYFFFENFGLFAEVGYGPFEAAIIGVSGRF